MEITLEMLTTEKDEDCLLASKDLQDAIAETDDGLEHVMGTVATPSLVDQASSSHVGTSCGVAWLVLRQRDTFPRFAMARQV